MVVNYVVFDLSTGEPVRWGQCQEVDLAAQAGDGERALATKSFAVADNAAIIWEEAKVVREAKVDGGAPTPSGVVDSDTLARSNIAGATLAATIARGANQPYSVVWTLQDNTTVTLDADAMIAVGLAVMAHVDACYSRGRVLRAAIDGAADMAELLAIDIEAGWPT